MQIDDRAMEFLVRLNDKIRAQVLCLNPVHKNSDMERVVFEDNTFSNSCPECGETEWLFRKNNAAPKKGHFVTFKPDGWSWGFNELKHFGIVRIDCTYEQAKEWCQTVENIQAQKNLKHYEDLVKANENRIVSNALAGMPHSATRKQLRETIIKAFESDKKLLELIDGVRATRNLITIAHRNRKYVFDFEKVLGAEQLRTWNRMDGYSEIVIVSKQDEFQIREI